MTSFSFSPKTLTFDKAGDYTYSCKIHPNMVARLQVR